MVLSADHQCFLRILFHYLPKPMFFSPGVHFMENPVCSDPGRGGKWGTKQNGFIRVVLPTNLDSQGLIF